MSGARRLLAALAMAGASLIAAPSVDAADDATQILIGQTAGAITVDVTGDGVRELVRVVADPTRPHRFLLESWAHDGERWSLIGSTDVIRHNEGHDARVPINTSADAFGLLAWNDGGAERLLLATVGHTQDVGGCCLTVSAVTMSGGSLRADPLIGTFSDASVINVLDVDGDGTDELLVVEMASRCRRRRRGTPAELERRERVRCAARPAAGGHRRRAGVGDR